jgi:hypothetical protein
MFPTKYVIERVFSQWPVQMIWTFGARENMTGFLFGTQAVTVNIKSSHKEVCSTSFLVFFFPSALCSRLSSLSPHSVSSCRLVFANQFVKEPNVARTANPNTFNRNKHNYNRKKKIMSASTAAAATRGNVILPAMLPSTSATTSTLSQQLQQKGPFNYSSSSSSSSENDSSSNSSRRLAGVALTSSSAVTVTNAQPVAQKFAGLQFSWVHFLAGG